MEEEKAIVGWNAKRNLLLLLISACKPTKVRRSPASPPFL
jgi:hypothetical protein